MADEELRPTNDGLPPDAELADLARGQLQLHSDADLAVANTQTKLGRVASLRSQLGTQQQPVLYEDDRLGIKQKSPYRKQ